MRKRNFPWLLENTKIPRDLPAIRLFFIFYDLGFIFVLSCFQELATKKVFCSHVKNLSASPKLVARTLVIFELLPNMFFSNFDRPLQRGILEPR